MIKIGEIARFTPKVKKLLFTPIFFSILLLTITISIVAKSNFFGNLIFLLILLGLPSYIYISLWYSHSSFVVKENAIIIKALD